MMTNEMDTTEKLSVVLGEARVMGVEVLPPDVNEGDVFFAPAVTASASRAPDGGPPQAGSDPRPGGIPPMAIRFGLAAIKGVGEMAVRSILEARAAAGPFKSLADLCERVDTRTVNRKVLEALIKCGACDCFGQTRASLLAGVEHTLLRAANVVADRQRGQSSLFAMLDARAAAPGEDLPRLPEWPQSQLLAAEKELLGFYVTGHPLTPYAPLLERYTLCNSTSARGAPARTLTRVGGLVAGLQPGVSKKTNKPYIMVSLEDLEGTMSMLVMNENYDKYRDLVVLNKALLIVGEINNSEDKPKIFPQEIIPLEDAPRKYTRQVHLRLHAARLTQERLAEVHRLVTAHPGKCPLYLCFVQPGVEVVFVETHEHFRVNPGPALQQAADALLGEGAYYAKVDTSLPERVQRRWEKKAENGNDAS
jgi:DNA polymerase III subunit alpha